MCPDEELYSATPGKANGSVCELPSAYDEQVIAENGVKVYPNPVTDILNIEADETVESVVVYSASGSKVFEAAGEVSTIDVQHLQRGIYVLEVVVAGNVQRMKLVRY